MNVDALIRSVAKKFSKASVSLLSYQDSDSNTQLVSSSNPLPVNATVSGGLTIDELTALYTVMTLKVNDADSEAVLSSILAKLISNPATETTSAAILAKLISNPATETTSAAILAKLISNPATESTSAAILALESPSGSTVVNKAPSTTPMTILNANSSRKGVMFYNNNASYWVIKLGSSPTSSSFSFVIQAGGFFELNKKYTGIITGYCGAASGLELMVTELT